MGERGVGRPLGQVAANSIGSDEQGRLENPMLRGQIATFEIDEAALACAAERAVNTGEGRPGPSGVLLGDEFEFWVHLGRLVPRLG